MVADGRSTGPEQLRVGEAWVVCIAGQKLVVGPGAIYLIVLLFLLLS
jgi:hypothetical protein